ncbi:M48 family metalloprotease [Diaphorobacter aerolatus]|uniref:M48 family metalloprotease n=1 Tax=Diaphorobacter aerolatus TaxID=1288495 RepID=A0A7H0GH96_9BURK|nr:M48 family metalloprotease [Diaphorobacter aerolatus]QNP47662.1 M48 family metalloprotease [Diaphorobacter aerolatus]
MDKLVYPREKTLGTITLVLGIIVWILLILGTLGVALIYVLFAFIGYLFAQSALIAWLRGTGVRLSDQQLPELYSQYLGCCEKLGIKEPPEAYLLQGDGMMNAFATRFLGREFVIVLSDTVDAMNDLPDGVNFYFGHELGHIKQGHLTGHIWRAPVLWLPLLGAAYSRAKEYTCDMHGRACCATSDVAARALIVLAAGSDKWRLVNLADYARQTMTNRGFFPDLHELISGYPWLTKRVARVLNPDIKMPGRNPFSYLFALFIPYAGRFGGGAGGLVLLMMIIAIIGMLAAAALPAYQEYQGRAELTSEWANSTAARTALGEYYVSKEEVPDSLEDAGISAAQAAGFEYDATRMSLTKQTKLGNFVLVPSELEGKVQWHCYGEGKRIQKALPAGCKADEEEAD